MAYFGISGIPAQIKYAQAMAQHVPERTADAQDRGVAWLTGELRAKAAKHPAWAELADSLHIEVDPRTGHYTVGSTDERATNLEFGTQDTPPQPFLRSTLKRLEQDMARRYSQELSY